METIIQKLQNYTREDPNAVILYDEAHSNGISYAKLDDMSGRVYAYLKSKGIGKEDFVLINLPRGVLPVVAMIGIWKDGAAWALVEDTYAPDRIAYIREDCGCKFELSAVNWDEVMRTEPLAGYTAAADRGVSTYAIPNGGDPYTGRTYGSDEERPYDNRNRTEIHYVWDRVAWLPELKSEYTVEGPNEMVLFSNWNGEDWEDFSRVTYFYADLVGKQMLDSVLTESFADIAWVA